MDYRLNSLGRTAHTIKKKKKKSKRKKYRKCIALCIWCCVIKCDENNFITLASPLIASAAFTQAQIIKASEGWLPGLSFGISGKMRGCGGLWFI